MGALEVLLELLDMHTYLPGEAPMTVWATSRGWRVFTRTEAVTKLRLMVGCSGREPISLRFTREESRGGGRDPVSVARYF